MKNKTLLIKFILKKNQEYRIYVKKIPSSKVLKIVFKSYSQK